MKDRGAEGARLRRGLSLCEALLKPDDYLFMRVRACRSTFRGPLGIAKLREGIRGGAVHSPAQPSRPGLAAAGHNLNREPRMQAASVQRTAALRRHPRIPHRIELANKARGQSKKTMARPWR